MAKELDPPVFQGTPKQLTPPADDNRHSMARICKEHHGELVGSLRKQTGSVEEAKDIAQDAYLERLEDPQPKTDEHHRHTLFWTAKRRAIDWFRKQRYRNQRTEEMASANHAQPNELELQVLTEEQNQLLARVLTELPPRYRLILQMGVLDNIPQKEIARHLGRSPRRIRTYQNLALTYCELRLNGHSAIEANRRVKL